jgi:hypothetical protein
LVADEASAVARLRHSHPRAERWFFSGMALLFLVVTFAGFSRTYYLKGLFGTPPLSPLLHVHGIVFSLWLILLVVQTGLVATNRRNLHRRLGLAGLGLAIAMVLLGTTTAIVRAKIGAAPVGPLSPLSFLIIPLGDMLAFGALCGAAFWFRRQVAAHKRLMLLATIAILPAAVARLPFDFIASSGPLAFFGIPDLLVLVCVLFDFSQLRRIHPATLWGGLFLIASHPLRMLIAPTPAWLSFAERITQWS